MSNNAPVTERQPRVQERSTHYTVGAVSLSCTWREPDSEMSVDTQAYSFDCLVNICRMNESVLLRDDGAPPAPKRSTLERHQAPRPLLYPSERRWTVGGGAQQLSESKHSLTHTPNHLRQWSGLSLLCRAIWVNRGREEPSREAP